MAKKSNFLKNLLTTASAFAVIAGGSSAMAALITSDNVGAVGVADGQALVNAVGVPVGPVNWTANDSLFLTHGQDINLGIGGAGASVGTIDINNNAGRTMNVVANSSVGSIISSTGAQTAALIINNGKTFTLSATAGLNKSGAGQPGGVYTGLGTITLGSGGGGSTLQIDTAATLAGAINSDAAVDGIINVNATNVVFNGILGAGGKIGTLQIQNAKNATLGNTATIGAITLGAGSALEVAAGKTITAVTIDNAGGTGTLKFAAGATAAIDKIGNGAAVNLVEIGAGQVDFTTTSVYKATTTHLKDAASIVKFSRAAALTLATDFTTETNGAGKIIATGGDRTFTGAIGTDAKRIGELHVTTNDALIFDKADTNLYVNAVTTAADANGSILIKQNNFAIYANIGATGKTFNTVTIDKAGGAITAKLMDGKSIFANGGVSLSAAGNQNNILELYNGTAINGKVFTGSNGNGILSVKGDSTISKGVVIGGGGELIDQIRFDAAKTLTLAVNTAQTTNGINFLEDGTLELTENAVFAFDKTVATKVDANGTGTIRANVAGLGKTLTFTGQIGDVLVVDGSNSLKLLEAKGGANIILTNSASIKKINIEGVDSTLTLNKAGGKYMIGNFSHSDNQGTLAIAENNIVLKKGSSFGTAANRMKAITFDADRTLNIEDGIDLFTTNDANGGFRNAANAQGILVFAGDSTVGAVVGLNNKFNRVEVNGAGKTVTFQEKVNLNGNVIVDNGATAILQGEVVAGDIQGKAAGNGTVEFQNKAPLAGATAISSTVGTTFKLNTVEIGGADITFTKGDFKTTNLVFANAGLTATFEALAANSFQNTVITSTGDGIHNIVLSKNIGNQQFDRAVGAAGNSLGNFVITSDDGINDVVTFNDNFFGSVTTQTNQKGEVFIAGLNSVANNLGSAALELRKVNLNNNATVGNVWSKEINVLGGKTIAFKGIVASSAGLTLQNGAIANFTGPNVVLSAGVEAANAGQGTARFDDTATITRAIGQGKNLQLIEFTGTNVSQVASVGADLFATNINVGAQTFKPTTNIVLNGATSFNNGSVVDLGTNNVTLKNGASRLVGDVTLGLTLNATGTTGRIIVDGANGAASFDPNLANSVRVQITDNAPLPVTAQTFDLVTLANGGTATNLTKGSITQPTTNRFVKWTLTGNNKIVRENNAEQTLVSILGKLNDAELLADAKLYGNANNKGDAMAYTSELSQMTDARIQESLERLTEQNAVHATAVVGQTTTTVNNSINNRIALLTNHPTPGIQTASVGTSGVAAGDENAKFGAWISPFYATTTQKDQGSRAGYKTQASGGSIGFDAEVNADMTLGLAGSFVKTDVKHKNFKSGDKTKLDTFMFSIYGIQQLTEAWFLQGHASFASSKVKNTEKRITLTGSQNATGSFDTTAYSAEVLAGYNVAMNDAVVTPIAGASFTRVNDGGYKETGTTNQNLTISRKASNKVEVVAGLRAQMTSHMDGIDLTPEFHGFVRHDLVGKSSKVTASHGGLVGQLTPKTAKIQKTTFNAGVGVNAVSGMYEYGAGYDLFLANKLIGHQGTLKVRVNF